MSCKFRAATAYDPRLLEGMRCPVCARIALSGEGITVVEEGDGGISLEGLDLGRRRTGEWTCVRCGYRADEASRPSRLLARAVLGSRFADLG